jgi:hypothetical protein
MEEDLNAAREGSERSLTKSAKPENGFEWRESCSIFNPERSKIEKI